MVIEESVMAVFRKSLSALILALTASAALADATLLNASYDVARDVYKDYNPMFQKYFVKGIMIGSVKG